MTDALKFPNFKNIQVVPWLGIESKPLEPLLSMAPFKNLSASLANSMVMNTQDSILASNSLTVRYYQKTQNQTTDFLYCFLADCLT